MSSGRAQIQRWIASVRKLPLEARAEALAPVVREELARTISAGTSPDGVPWPRRVDGAPALANALAATEVVPMRGSIACVVTGPEAIHHYGTKKDPRRQILPTTLPGTWGARLRSEVLKRFARVLGGRG